MITFDFNVQYLPYLSVVLQNTRISFYLLEWLISFLARMQLNRVGYNRVSDSLKTYRVTEIGRESI